MTKKRLLWIFIIVILAFLAAPYLIPLPDRPELSPEALAAGNGRFLTVQGVRTYIVDIGPRNGPAVVLIHGFGGSTFSWRETLPALAVEGYRAVALDLKGFGLSDKQFEEDYGHASQAVFISGVMDALGIDKAAIIGHSMGGSIIAHFAYLYPQKVERLVFVDGSVDTGAGSSISKLVGSLVRFPPVREWARFVMRWLLTEERVVDRLLTAYYDAGFVTPEIEAGYLAPQRIKDWDLALLGIVRDSAKNNLPAPVDQVITQPTLVIWGEEDTWVPLVRGLELNESIPGSELYVIPKSGHLPMEERPELFNSRLLEFLAANPE